MLPNTDISPEDNHQIWLKPFLIACLGVVGILHLIMALKLNVHWDEFFLLDWVYKWNSDELNLALQTIFLRLFSWLPQISENEVNQIIGARMLMLLCLGITSSFIYGLCRKFTTTVNAVFSLILFLTMTFIFTNASNFRVDMMVVTVLMGIIWSIVTPKLTWTHILAGGFFFGLAGMMTIKSIFYAPIIAAILFSHWGASNWKSAVFVKCVSMGIWSVICFISLYVLHSLSLSGASSSADYLSHAVSGSLLETKLFPRQDIMRHAIKTNLLVFALITLGIIYSATQIFEGKNKWAYVAAMSFIFPFLTVVFYSHGYAYFYTFMLAPATVLIAVGLNAPIFKKNTLMLPICLAFTAFNTAALTIKSIDQKLNAQREVLEEIHTLFPAPTAYIDRCAMVSSFPKSGLFMSYWMMGDYYNAAQPIMPNILKTQQPKFILANIDSLNLDNISPDTDRRLLPKDEALLKGNYIPHWGPVYVAGKELEITEAQDKSFEIFIAGPYAIESEAPVKIDGEIYHNADKVNLNQGLHRLSPLTATIEPQKITLRWNALPIPNKVPPKTKLF